MGLVDLVVDSHVATITLNDPKTRNALDAESAHRVLEICAAIERDLDVGAAVVRGAGGTFCSGAARHLLKRAGEDPAEPERFDSVGAVYDAFVRIGELPVPTIAAVRGAAVGAGVNLLLATDLRIVAADARIITGFLQIGIHPGGGHFTLLGRLAGRETAAAMGLFGEEISGSQARELHLAWEAVADDDVEPRAFELAKQVASDPQLARRAVGSLRGELGPPVVSWPVAVAMERANQMWSLRRRHETSRQ